MDMRVLRLVALLVAGCALYLESAYAQNWLKQIPVTIDRPVQEVYQVDVHPMGFVYCATNQGLLRFDGSDWFRIDLNLHEATTALKVLEDGSIAVGAKNNFGIVEYHSDSGFVYTSLSSRLPGDELLFGEIWQVLEQKDQVVFQSYKAFFTWDGLELVTVPIEDAYLFDIGGTLYASQYPDGRFGAVSDDMINATPNWETIGGIVFQVFPKDERAWLLGTAENGFFEFEPQAGLITKAPWSSDSFFKTAGFYDGLKVNDSTLLLGTWEQGMTVSDLDGNILHSIVDRNLSTYGIWHASLGLNNDVWLATDNGLERVILDSLGLISSRTQRTNPRVVVSRVISKSPNNSSTSWLDYHSPQEVSIKYSPENLSIIFAAPAYAGENVEFSYLMEGIDSEWGDWTSDAHKDYTYLSHGQYVFRVKARTANGEVTEETSIGITIQVPWFQRPIRYAILTLLILGVALTAGRLRTVQLRKRNRKLESIIQERTKDLVLKSEKLQQANQELTTSNRELDSFVYHTSHDLKAPLKSVLGLVALSKSEAGTQEQLQLYLEMMEKSILKLEEFIHSIIEYSTNVKSAVHREKINLNDIVDESVQQLSEFENVDQIEIRKDIEVNGNFYSDPRRLQIILSNLLSNSIKYHDFQKPNPYIEINAKESGSLMELAIRDNGTGITKRYHKDIFEMFFRASENATGSGLGLYIVKETVAKLDGQITFQSKYREGTEFVIKLPLGK